MIGVLRFASVITRLLAQTDGNLYALNMINRLGEYSDNQQVRLAANAVTMADVAGIRLLADGSWHDPAGRNRNQHALGEPLTGAVFDMLVEIFQAGLVARGLVARDMDGRGWARDRIARAMPALRRRHAHSLHSRPEGYEEALLAARDVVGYGMAHAMRTLSPGTLSFDRVAARLLEAAAALGQGREIRILLRLFLRRGIDPRPFLRIERRALHFHDDAEPGGRCPDRAAFLHAHRLVRHGHGPHRH